MNVSLANLLNWRIWISERKILLRAILSITNKEKVINEQFSKHCFQQPFLLLLLSVLNLSVKFLPKVSKQNF